MPFSLMTSDFMLSTSDISDGKDLLKKVNKEFSREVCFRGSCFIEETLVIRGGFSLLSVTTNILYPIREIRFENKENVIIGTIYLTEIITRVLFLGFVIGLLIVVTISPNPYVDILKVTLFYLFCGIFVLLFIKYLVKFRVKNMVYHIIKKESFIGSKRDK